LTGSAPHLYAIGEIVKAHGVDGECVVRLLTDMPQRFKKLKQVFVGRSADSVYSAGIERVHIGPRGVRLKLASVSDRAAAIAMVGLFVFVGEDQRIKLARGTYFVHDLVGMSVVREDGENVGTVREVLKMPANDIYVVAYDGREVMIPAVKEFIKKIDVATRTITVSLIDGMME
jgi:16S rRNA processing protein RimM